MKFSVITATLNSEGTIAQNALSVIHQTYEDFEQIIIDNLSTDKTIEKIKRIYSENNILNKLKIISEKDDGIADAFNKGINNSTGDVIVILNSDDSFYDHGVLLSAAEAFQNSRVLIVHGDIYFDDPLYGSNIRQPLPSKITGIEFNHPGMFVRSCVYSDVGLYNTAFRYSMDFEFYCRIKNLYQNPGEISFYINRPLVRMNAGGASWKNEVNSIKEIRKAYKLNKLWGFDASLHFWGRYFRATVKKCINLAGLNFLVHLWRKLKWKG